MNRPMTVINVQHLDAILHGANATSHFYRELAMKEAARREAAINDFLISGAMLRDLCQVESKDSRTVFCQETFAGWTLHIATDWRIN